MRDYASEYMSVFNELLDSLVDSAKELFKRTSRK